MVHIDTDTTQPNAVRLLVQGQLDLTAVSAFNAALTGAARLRRPVQLDLVKIDFIDGCGLSMLMSAMSRARRVGCELMIVAASRQVRRLIEITGTADRLPPLRLERNAHRARADRQLTRGTPEASDARAFRI
jgi:anti-anti-sigma factor